MFIHLWGKGGKRHSRAITSDLSGENMFVLDERVNLSHYAWKSDTELLVHTSRVPHGVKFNLYEDLKGYKETIGRGVLNESGHPSFSPDGKRLIVDTYPDRAQQQHLFLCASDGSLIREVGQFHCPRGFAGDDKCDLHPRWDRTGSKICVDSAVSGRRAMYIIDLD